MKIAFRAKITSNKDAHNIKLPDNFQIADKNGIPEVNCDKKIGEVVTKISDDKKQLVVDTQEVKDNGKFSVSGKYKDGENKGQDCLLEIIYNPAKWSLKPVIGMITSGIVTVFGLYKSTSSDEKNLPYGLTVLGLIGFGTSAIWKWGWPKIGGGSYSGSGTYDPNSSDTDYVTAAAVLMSDPHYWNHGGGGYYDSGDHHGGYLDGGSYDSGGSHDGACGGDVGGHSSGF